MGGQLGNTMGDTSALEKQLNLKTKSIVGLKATLDEKSRFLFDQHDMFQNKIRSTYYLERTIEARTRELNELKKEAEDMEAKAAVSGFAGPVDEGEAKIAEAEAAEQGLSAQVDASSLSTKSLKFQSDVYSALMKRVDAGTLGNDKITDELQKTLKGLESDNAVGRQETEDIKAAIEAVQADYQYLKNNFNSLDQFRVDAIFRIFTLKGQIKVKKDRLAAE